MTEIVLRYRWRFTWPERGKDYTATDEDVVIGRMRHDFNPALRQEMWFWSLQAFQGIGGGNMQGMLTGEVRAAAAFFEDHYDAMTSLSSGLNYHRATAEIAFYERKGLPVPEAVLRREMIQRR